MKWFLFIGWMWRSEGGRGLSFHPVIGLSAFLMSVAPLHTAVDELSQLKFSPLNELRRHHNTGNLKIGVGFAISL
jgi:hypothetical protein